MQGCESTHGGSAEITAAAGFVRLKMCVDVIDYILGNVILVFTFVENALIFGLTALGNCTRLLRRVHAKAVINHWSYDNQGFNLAAGNQLIRLLRDLKAIPPMVFIQLIRMKHIEHRILVLSLIIRWQVDVKVHFLLERIAVEIHFHGG
ncbi:hypothetical protein D3C71_881400 [compost metagenome]